MAALPPAQPPALACLILLANPQQALVVALACFVESGLRQVRGRESGDWRSAWAARVGPHPHTLHHTGMEADNLRDYNKGQPFGIYSC